MKKLFSVFAIVALVGMFACTQKADGPSQEEFDKLSKEIVDKDTQIAQLQDDLDLLTADMDLCAMERDSLLELTTKKTGGTKKTNTTTTTTTTNTGTGGRGDMKGTNTTTTATTTGGRGDMKKK
jgi:hypothetical protein